jgi:hypothetical protein
MQFRRGEGSVQRRIHHQDREEGVRSKTIGKIITMTETTAETDGSFQIIEIRSDSEKDQEHHQQTCEAADTSTKEMASTMTIAVTVETIVVTEDAMIAENQKPKSCVKKMCKKCVTLSME